MLASILSTIPFHFSEPVRSPSLCDRNVTNGITITTDYINYTMQDVIIALRCGVKMKVPKIVQYGNAISYKENVFITRVTYSFYNSNSDELFRALSEVKENITDKAINIMHEELQNFIKNKSFGRVPTNFVISIDYPVHLNDIIKNGGLVYSNEGDVIVSTRTLEETPMHPFTRESRYLSQIKEHAAKHKSKEIQFSIKIIDNHASMSVKFYNIGNKVYKVVPYSDLTMEEGIYFSGDEPVKSIHQSEGKVVMQHPLEAATTLGLFSTIEDALTSGDPAVLRKNMLAELEHENLMAKKTIEANKIAYEQFKIDIEKEKKLWDMSIDLVNAARDKLIKDQEREAGMEELRIKGKYEKESHARKNTTEILKFIPAAVAAISTIFSIAKKFA